MKTDYRNLCLEQDSPEVEAGKGRNVIPPPEKEPLWKGYLRKFQDPLIIVLLVVFFFSVAVSIYEVFWMGKSTLTLIEPVGVLIALLLATGIGFILEVKADREFDVLNKKREGAPVAEGSRPHQGQSADLSVEEKRCRRGRRCAAGER